LWRGQETAARRLLEAVRTSVDGTEARMLVKIADRTIARLSEGPA
jgi:hypothetical protein